MKDPSKAEPDDDDRPAAAAKPKRAPKRKAPTEPKGFSRCAAAAAAPANGDIPPNRSIRSCRFVHLGAAGTAR